MQEVLRLDGGFLRPARIPIPWPLWEAGVATAAAMLPPHERAGQRGSQSPWGHFAGQFSPLHLMAR